MEADQFDWRLDKESSVALYEQLRRRIIEAADDGELPVGTKLPPVRRLADHLGIVPHTVARAYRELETAGRVKTAGRAGTVISAGADETAQLLAEAADRFAAVVKSQSIGTEAAVAAVKAALER
ncbi:GntR family transcriptional regulator [Arthrobacter crystallopoietes BAB-32]|uniref:GntR family transcriptional regulator n=1 Tax=Arthrobacter crystallopoietes BAB-32 TaxID=1246476 RepID=N1V7D3_9MICC|nr:GntR family transcriptional regulator [Arthrobacter crystallopoietes]EMY35904.1 GntR family transcriptional regulator [Arthrobacter crystallopoietes BAB-32]